MITAKAFGSALSRIRKEQGFSSAHQFFKSVGGSKTLGLAFISYWDMERGKKLPRSWRLKTLMAALGINNNPPKIRELISAYFIALSGSDELPQILAGQAAAGGDLPSRELAETATHRALAQRAVNLTLEQWKLRTRDLVTNICQCFLANTEGWVTVRELSDATKFKPAEVKKALKALASGGLVELSGDKARSPFAKKVIQQMPAIPETAPIVRALRGQWKTWLANSKYFDGKAKIVRMTKTDLEIYNQHLSKAVDLASVYSNVEADREDSALYYIDGSIYQVLPRD